MHRWKKNRLDYEVEQELISKDSNNSIGKLTWLKLKINAIANNKSQLLLLKFPFDECINL